MKTSLVLGGAAALLLASNAANAAVTTYVATLNGAQEVPAVTTTKTGSATLLFNDANNKLTGTVTLTGFANGDVTNQHIHTGACGVANGPVAQALTAPVANVITVNVTLDGQQATDLAAGKLYVNVHTGANTGGEIRGQLYLQGGTQVCPDPDAGTNSDGGSTSSSGASSTSSTSSSSSSSSGDTSSSTSSSGGSNGATTERTDAGDTSASDSGDDGGCSTTGSSSTSGATLAAGLAIGLAVAFASRKRRR